MTIPNALSVFRLLSSFVLPFLAYYQQSQACAWLLLAMWISDWLDGKLARLLHQRSELGAHLDSLGDVLLYVAAVPSLLWLRPDFIEQQWPWLLAVGVSYALNVLFSAARFRKPPAHHTRTAKTCWLLGGIGLMVLFFSGPQWPALVAAAGAFLANLEGMAVTFVLPEARTDVGSLWHVLQERKGPEGE